MSRKDLGGVQARSDDGYGGHGYDPGGRERIYGKGMSVLGLWGILQDYAWHRPARERPSMLLPLLWSRGRMRLLPHEGAGRIRRVAGVPALRAGVRRPDEKIFQGHVQGQRQYQLGIRIHRERPGNNGGL